MARETACFLSFVGCVANREGMSMSTLNICLLLLSVMLWASIFLVRYKGEIKDWYLNRFDRSPPPRPPEGKAMPEVSLPFRYDSTPPDKEE